MKRMDRLMAILIALQQEPATAQRLAEKFEVTKRTILRDMQSLSEMGVPIYAVSGPSGGFRLMDGFRLPPLQLDAGEALAVFFALSSLTKMADTPFRQARWTVLDKLKAVMPEQTLEYIESKLAVVEVEVPQRSVQSPYLSELLAHTAEARWIRVHYRSEKQTRWLQLWPRKIYTAHGYWYSEAYSVTHGEWRTFRIDRMIEVEAMELSADEAARMASLLERPAEAEEESSTRIIASLTYRGALLAEQDLHIGDSVRQVDEETWELDFICPASERSWAERFFFTLGMDAEVKAPAHLKEALFGMAKRLCGRYGSGHTTEG
ncbi:helix-turn-helix transcriptional regulator [Paenibacillus montanisoli]|uniref:DNA-binding transcriptional regulator n=1 Tax=Paenibacillus montanisoli TaxID=2081970 RepID=A0A328TWZ1_9BACL|nr:YafY family protein [Paenibacillus montanisoli]RAP73601.1 DNA-binding transcriptional regulator [Paenibacillus montanisoli]